MPLDIAATTNEPYNQSQKPTNRIALSSYNAIIELNAVSYTHLTLPTILRV